MTSYNYSDLQKNNGILHENYGHDHIDLHKTMLMACDCMDFNKDGRNKLK